MKRISLLVALLISHISLNAIARDMNGLFGIGLDGSPGGYAIAGRYYFTKNFGIGAQFGASFSKLKNVDAGFGILFGAHSIYNFTEGRETNLGTFVEMDILVADNNVFHDDYVIGKVTPMGGGETGVAIIIDLGLRPEIFIADEFAIHASFGIEFLIGSEEFYKRSLFSTQIGGLAYSGLLGTFGFTYYF